MGREEKAYRRRVDGSAVSGYRKERGGVLAVDRSKWRLSYRVGVFVLFPGASAVVTRLWGDERVSLPVFLTVGALLIVGCLACDL